MRRSATRRTAGVLLGALLVVGAACGDDEAEPDVSDPPITSPSATEPTADDTTTTVPLSNTDLPVLSDRPQQPPKEPTDSFRPITIRGRVEAGFEAGCIELVTDGGRYVLIGDAAVGLVAGSDVEVDGIASPQLRTICNGSPFQVSAVRPA